jgi:hypothetical protein
MSVVAVIPSRGRPERALIAADALRKQAVLVGTMVVLAIDADDPMLPGYYAPLPTNDIYHRAEISRVVLCGYETGNLVKATNTVSLRIARENPATIIGNLGDDHVCRTEGWDKMVADALVEPGIAYGRDGIHDEHLPTAPFISGEIVSGLGWYALPTCHHLYIDDVWRELGQALGRLRYLPDLFIEHLHPAVGKADTDAGYVQAQANVDADRYAYEEWQQKYKDGDVRAVLRALA